MGKTRNIKLIYLQGSQGIEIPDSILKKYGFSDSLILEETEEGILIRKQEEKLSWEKTYQAMAEEKEDWSDFDQTLLDGIEGEYFDS